MPELPEVEVTRRGFADRIAGARIESVRVGKPLRWALAVEPGANSIQDRGQVLAQIRPIGARALGFDFARRRKQPAVLFANRAERRLGQLALHEIQQIRNEAHRFAITFHRNTRSKAFVNTELKGIKGVGDKTAEKLLKHFGSVKKLKEANQEDIINLVGQSIAGKLFASPVFAKPQEGELDPLTPKSP